MSDPARIIGVNGIRSDGGGNTDLLLADLAERRLATIDFNYPRVNFITARWRYVQRENGRLLYLAARRGDHVVAHSYGALVVLRAMERGARFGQVFLFGPAMGSRAYFPAAGAENIHVIHNRADRAVGLGARLWRHDFGLMGQSGYAGPPDERVTNVATDDDHAAHERLHHSDYFLPANRRRWVDYVARTIRVADGG